MEQVRGAPRKVMRIKSHLPKNTSENYHDHMPKLLADLESGKITTEEFFWHKRVCEELDKATERRKNGDAVWLTEEEFWAGVKARVERAQQ